MTEQINKIDGAQKPDRMGISHFLLSKESEIN